MKSSLTLLIALVLCAPARAQDTSATADAVAQGEARVDAEGAAPEGALATEPADAPRALDSEPEPEVSVVTTEASSDPEPQPSVHAAPEAPHAGPELSFANSFFTWTNGVTLHTFAPGAQLSYDPTFEMSFAVMPRFYLTDTTFLWLNQSMDLELTDTNGGSHNREPLLSDTLLDLRQLVTFEGFVFQGQARLGFPLSKASQAAGRVLQTGLGLTITRPFPEAADFTVAATIGYRRWWATRNVANAEEQYTGSCFSPEPGQPPICSQAGGATTARDILIAGLTLSVSPYPGLSVSAGGFTMSAYGHEVSSGDVSINGGQVQLTDDSPTHWRPYTYFSLSVAYDVSPWLNLQLGVQNAAVAAPLYNPDGSVRSPFTADTQVFLTTTLGLDSLYGEISGGGGDDDLTPEERQRRRDGLASTEGRNTM